MNAENAENAEKCGKCRGKHRMRKMRKNAENAGCDPLLLLQRGIHLVLQQFRGFVHDLQRLPQCHDVGTTALDLKTGKTKTI